MMKKLITLILVFTAVLTLVSCNKPSDGEILTEYKALYEKAREVNKMIYGEGLPYDGEYDVSSLASPVYVTVSESCPYKTLEDIKTAVLSVYTEDYYNDVFKRVLFDGHTDDYATLHPRYKEEDGILKTDIAYKAFDSIVNGSVDLEAAKVKKSSSGAAEVVAPYYLKGVRQANDKTTMMILTENGWRFDNLA